MDMTKIIKKLVGPPDSVIHLGVERGHRYPILFSHMAKAVGGKKNAGGGQYKAPPDAFYLEVVRESPTGTLGVELERASGPDAITEEPQQIRDVQNIVHDGAPPSPKIIKSIKPGVGPRLPTGHELRPLCFARLKRRSCSGN